MNPKVLLRGILVLALSGAVLGAIGMMLAPAQARPAGVFDWPGTVAPCNDPASVQTCIDGLLPGDEIHLLAGTYVQSMTLNKAVSLLGAGTGLVVFSAPPGQRVLTVDGPIGAGTVISGFTLQDGNVSGSLCPEACGGGMLITGTARPTLQNLFFFNNNAAYQGGGLWVAAGPEVRLTDVTFFSNTSEYAGGGLYADAPLALQGVSFNQNGSNFSDGGGLAAPALKAVSSSFLNNRTSSGNGGGAFVLGSAILTGTDFSMNNGSSGAGLLADTLVATNTVFRNNIASGSSGGGANVNGAAQLNNVTFSLNTAPFAGGGLYAGTLTAFGGGFDNNSVSGVASGGGAYIIGGVNTLENMVFQNNSSGYSGGGLYTAGEIQLTDVTMIGNTALSSYGGAVEAAAALKVLGGNYENNRSELSGGAIYVFGPAQLENSHFRGNTSNASTGGAVYVDGTLGVTNTRFVNNTASDGSAIWHASGDGRVVNSLFTRNTHGSVGAELALNSSGQFEVLHSTFADPGPSIAPTALGANFGMVNVTDTIITSYTYGIAAGSATVTEDYNLYFGNAFNWSGSVITGLNSLEGDPLFVDPATGDYHLQTASPAIDTGVDVGLNFDIDRQPRPILAGYDIGFDEMGSLLQIQIDAAAPGDTIHVAPGVYTESLRLWKPVSLIGDGAQTTIVNALPDQRALIVSDPAITATTVISGLTFQHGNLRGTLCPQDCGGGILINGGATPRLENLVLLENHAYQGGGLWADIGPELQLVNVAFINNTSQNDGGGLYAYSAFRALNSRFENSTSGQSGGGAYTPDVATLENVTFTHNSAAWFGGGLNAGELNMTGGEFLNNSANAGGGAYISSAPPQMITQRAAAPQADIAGGVAQVTGGKFTGNVSTNGDGGGLFAGGDARISGTLFANNTADCYSACSASGGGAAVSGYANVVNTAFLGNRAIYGGGLNVKAGFEITASRFINNQARYAGGGLQGSYAGPGRVVNSLFTRNRGDGSAMQFDYALPVDVIHTTIADAVPVTGTAIYANSTDLTLINNIIAGQELGLLSSGFATQGNNLYFNNQVDVTGTITTSGPIITGLDPRFVNPLADDYHLRLGSPAVNQGVDAGVYSDIDGQPRPIGSGFEIGFDELIGTIQEAIDAAPPGGTVYIPGGIYTESLTLNKPVSLIGSGPNPALIRAMPNQRVITVTGSAITASTIISNLQFAGGDLRTSCLTDCLGGGMLITDQAHLQLIAVDIFDNFAVMGGGLYIQSGGVRLANTRLMHNEALQSGGGLYIAQSGVVVEHPGGSVENNLAVDGAGVFVQDGSYRPVSLPIVNNQASNWGGGLIVGGTGSAALNAVTIYSNSAVNSGGGVFIDLGQVEMLSGTLANNSSIYGGGVTLWQPVSVFTQTGGAIEQNIASSSGGGYYLNQGRLVLAGGAVSGNRAPNGAGLFLNSGRVQLQGTAAIFGNAASSFGGGAYLSTSGATLTQLGGSIQTNTAPNGGGVKMSAGTYALWGGLLAGNTAANTGGGVLLHSAAANFEQYGGQVIDNSAQEGGGIYILDGTTTMNTGALLHGNTATLNGGGIYILQGTATLSGTQIVSNTAAGAGGGAYVKLGSIDLQNSLVLSNTATEGAGLYVSDMAGAGGLRGGLVQANRATGYGGGVYLGSSFGITGTRFFRNSAYDGSAVEITGTAQARLVNAFIGENEAYGGSNASVRFDSSGTSEVLHTTFGNNTVPLTRALAINNGFVTVANSIVASYTNGLSQFGGYVAEDFNLYFQTPITFTGAISRGGHSLLGIDPLFKNPAVGDYHIKGFSPAVNMGTDVGVLRDIDLDARPLAGLYDIGADEASVASTTADPLTQTTFTYTTPQASTISLVVPPGAVTDTVPLYCSLIPSNTTPLPNSLSLAGFVFELDAQQNPLSNTLPGTINFNVPVTLTVSYTDQQLAEAGITDESTMLLYRYETSLNEWQPVGYRPGETQTLDIDNNVITASLMGLSRFGQAGRVVASFKVFLPLLAKN